MNCFVKTPTAEPSEPITFPKPLNCSAKSAGFIPFKVVVNNFALSPASAKSKLINELLIEPNPLLTCSNLEPEAKIATCSFASAKRSFNSPALCASFATCAESVAESICDFKSRNSFLIAPTPVIFKGTSISFISYG